MTGRKHRRGRVEGFAMWTDPGDKWWEPVGAADSPAVATEKNANVGRARAVKGARDSR